MPGATHAIRCRAASRSRLRPNGKAPCGRSRGECGRSRSTVLALVLFATYLGIGALAHDTHFSLGWALASTALVWAGPAQIILISTLGSGATVVQAAIAVTRQRDPAVSDGGVGIADAAHADDEAASSGTGGPFHRGHAVGRMLSAAAAGAARAAARLHPWARHRPGVGLPGRDRGRLRPRGQSAANCSPPRSCC